LETHELLPSKKYNTVNETNHHTCAPPFASRRFRRHLPPSRSCVTMAPPAPRPTTAHGPPAPQQRSPEADVAGGAPPRAAAQSRGAAGAVLVLADCWAVAGSYDAMLDGTGAAARRRSVQQTENDTGVIRDTLHPFDTSPLRASERCFQRCGFHTRLTLCYVEILCCCCCCSFCCYLFFLLVCDD